MTNDKLKMTNGGIIIIILAAILFFFKVGSFSLYDAAETTYGEFIKQIRFTGDWLTPYYNGKVLFDKPPLYFWLASIATFIFGFNEFAIRFWAALCGVLTVLATYFLGKSFHNERTGFFSAIIVMTSFQFLIQSRIAEIDILLTLLITLTFLAFYQAYSSGNHKYYLFMYITAALGMLTKGLVGIALPGFAIFLFLAIKKELPRLKEMKIIPGMILFLLIAAPWYVIEWHIHGKIFQEFVMGFLFLSRFQGVVSGHPGPWYYYFIALLLGFAPWSHFIPYAFIRTRRNNTSAPELLTLCYIAPVFMVFSIAQTKLPNYMLPIYPFLAIMVGKVWDDLFAKPANKLRGFLFSNLLLLIIVILIIIGFAILGTSNYSGQYQELLPNLQLLAGILIIGSTISISYFLFQKHRISFYAIPVMVFAIALVLTTQTLPAVEEYKNTRKLAQKVSENIKENEIIAAYDIGNRPGVVFYNQKPVVFLESEKEFKKFIKEKRGYCFTTDKNGELTVLP